jgi:hypothetical protein
MKLECRNLSKIFGKGEKETRVISISGVEMRNPKNGFFNNVFTIFCSVEILFKTNGTYDQKI